MGNSLEETWIGKNINYEELWNNYHNGKSYIEKFQATETTLVKFTFKTPDIENPIYNHEAVYKSLKGLYHDFKLYCLSETEYSRLPPMFVYSIERGSTEWIVQIAVDGLSLFLHAIALGFSIHQGLKYKSSNTPDNKISDKTDLFIKDNNREIVFRNLGENIKSVESTEKGIKVEFYEEENHKSPKAN